MATTVVYPSLDVSGTGSISTIISTAGTFTGSLTASSLTITGTATFSGTAVFVGTAQFLATVTFSATIVFANATVTTLGVSNTASFSVITVASTASVSATISVGALTITGFPAGSVLLGSVSFSVGTSLRFSGSWSDYSLFELHILVKSSGASNTGSIALYTDGGTTAIVSLTTGTISTGAYNYIEAQIINGAGAKGMKAENLSVATQTVGMTATANSAATINCIQFCAGTSATLSSGHGMLYGRRR